VLLHDGTLPFAIDRPQQVWRDAAVDGGVRTGRQPIVGLRSIPPMPGTGPGACVDGGPSVRSLLCVGQKLSLESVLWKVTQLDPRIRDWDSGPRRSKMSRRVFVGRAVYAVNWGTFIHGMNYRGDDLTGQGKK
jgi:hypothetical protein